MKLVLIDRDGVINEEIKNGYVKSPAELAIYPAALFAFKLFKENGFVCVVITNQSVVGRGIIDLKMLHNIHEFMSDAVSQSGGKIEEIFFCTDHPDKTTYRRKPNPGMLIEALEKYKADPAKTAFIGDAITDMQAAESAGCQRYMVLTGKGSEEKNKIPDALRPVIVCTDILDAAKKIIEAS